MRLELILFFAAVIVSLFKTIRKILAEKRNEEKQKTGNKQETNGPKPEESKLWDFLKGFGNRSFGWYSGWSVAILVLLFVIAETSNRPHLSPAKWWKDYAVHKNTTDVIREGVKEAETKALLDEQDKLREKEKPEYQDFKRSMEIDKKIADINAELDPVKKSAEPQRKLSNALKGDVYMNMNGLGYSITAKIDHLDDERLEISYLYSENGALLGKIYATWSEEEESYIGRWEDPYKKGDIKLKPFTGFLKEVYRLDCVQKNDSEDEWTALAITHRRDYDFKAVNCKTKS